MCVKLIKNNEEHEYDCNKTLQEQAIGCTEILVNYQPNDKEIEKFLQEMQYCVKSGYNPDIAVKVEYGDFLMGYKTNKEIVRALNDIQVNEIIKLIALSQHGTDKKLEEISMMCANRE